MPLQDDFYLGCANVPVASGLGVGAVTTGVGPIGRIVTYDVVPLTLQVANIAASQSPATAALTLTASTGTTAVTLNGVSVIKLDCPRVLRITSGGVDTGITFNVVGYDQYGVRMTQNITGASSAIATGTKAFLYVASITPSGSVASTCSVGTGDIFGLPFYVSDKGYILGVNWNNTLAKDASTVVTGVATTATSVTGDVRGTIAPSAGASDGVKRLVYTQVVSAAQTGSSATSAAIIGVTQA